MSITHPGPGALLIPLAGFSRGPLFPSIVEDSVEIAAADSAAWRHTSLTSPSCYPFTSSVTKCHHHHHHQLPLAQRVLSSPRWGRRKTQGNTERLWKEGFRFSYSLELPRLCLETCIKRKRGCKVLKTLFEKENYVYVNRGNWHKSLLRYVRINS